MRLDEVNYNLNIFKLPLAKFMLSYKGLMWQDYILFLIIKLITNILMLAINQLVFIYKNTKV
jgi:hypothetical protein